MRNISWLLKELEPCTCQWKRLDHNRGCRSVPHPVGDPAAVTGESCGARHGGVGAGDGSRSSIAKRERPQRVGGPLERREQTCFPVRRTIVRNVLLAALRLRQPFRLAAAIHVLPEEGAVAIAVRLKEDARAVRGPDRQAISPLERHSAGGGLSVEVVHKNERPRAVFAAECDPFAIARNARRLVLPRRKLQRKRLTSPVGQGQVVAVGGARRRTRDVGQQAVVRDGELGGRCRTIGARMTPSRIGTAVPTVSSRRRSKRTANTMPPIM